MFTHGPPSFPPSPSPLGNKLYLFVIALLPRTGFFNFRRWMFAGFEDKRSPRGRQTAEHGRARTLNI